MPTAPLRGWFLDSVVELDAFYPGFAGKVLRGSDEARHVFAAYLSSRRTEAIDGGEKAEFLSHARHSEILVAAFDDVPRGLRGALSRCGPQPFSRNFYRYLHAILVAESRPEMTLLIRRLPMITPLALKCARALPPPLRLPGIVSPIRNIQQARDLSSVYKLFVANELPEADMLKALGRAQSWRHVRQFAQRWAMRLKLPSHPVPGQKGYCPLMFGEDLKTAGREFANCMLGYLVEVLDGRSSFALASIGADRAVVHLSAKTGGWMLEDIYGPENGPVEASVEAFAEEYLLRHGIDRQPPRVRGRKWTPLARLSGQQARLFFD